MCNSKNNRNFHLDRVKKLNFLSRKVPHGVNAHRVDTIRFGLSSHEAIARAKNVEWQRETIVVNQTTIEREKAHHAQEIASFVKAGKCWHLFR